MPASFASVFNLANLTAPASGTTHAAKYLVSLPAGGTASINMQSQMEFLGPFVGQAMTVDNTGNTDPTTVAETTYGWQRIIPAGVSQTFQYPAVDQQNFTFTTAGFTDITVSIYDWPAFPDSASVVSGSGPASNVNVINAPTVHVFGTVPVSFAGDVTLAAGGTVTALQGTNPWLINGTATLAAGAANIGTVGVAGTVPVSGTIGVSGTVPVSGSVTVGGTVGLAAGVANIGTVAVSGTVPVSGTVGVSGTVPVSGTLTAALAAGGTVTVLEGTTPWTVQGNAASGVAVAGNPLLDGGRAANAEPAAVANGQAVALMADLLGRGIVFPYTVKENIINGSTSTTGTGAVTLIAAPGTLLSNFITSLQLTNTGTATVVATLNDTKSSPFGVPAGGASNIVFPMPLLMAANTALTMTSSGATTTLYGNAQGFKGLT